MQERVGEGGDELRGLRSQGVAFTVAPQMADAFRDDDAPAVMVTPGPTGLAPIPAVSRGAVVGPARASLAHQRTASKHRKTAKPIGWSLLGPEDLTGCEVR